MNQGEGNIKNLIKSLQGSCGLACVGLVLFLAIFPVLLYFPLADFVLVKAAGKTPTILIPGTMGTKIVATENFDTTEGQHFNQGDEVWGSALHVNQKKYLALEFVNDGLKVKPKYPTGPAAGGTLDNPMLDFVDFNQIYGPFHSFFENNGYIHGIDLFYFGWDWRAGAGEKDVNNNYVNVARLNTMVDAVRGSGKVNLVAHSQGGYVAWLYAKAYPSKVDHVITVGTPFLGSAKSAASILWGVNYGKSILVDLFGNIGPSADTVQRITTNMPGVAELLPRDPYIPYFFDDASFFGIPDKRMAANDVFPLIAQKRSNPNSISIARTFQQSLETILRSPPGSVKFNIIAGSGLPTWTTFRTLNLANNTKVMAKSNTGDETVSGMSHAANSVIPASVPRYFTFEQEHLKSVQGGTSLQIALNILNGVVNPIENMSDAKATDPFFMDNWVEFKVKSPEDLALYYGESLIAGRTYLGEIVQHYPYFSVFFNEMGLMHEDSILIKSASAPFLQFQLRLQYNGQPGSLFDLAAEEYSDMWTDQMYDYKDRPVGFYTLDWTSSGPPSFSGGFATYTHQIDRDGDGLSDAEEDFYYQTDLNLTDTDADGISDKDEVKNFNSSPFVSESDGDGCRDSREAGGDWHTGGLRSPATKYDFFDVPSPALKTGVTASKNKIISLQDVGAVLAFVGTWDNGPANSAGYDYDSDINGNGVEDGREYDRTPSTDPNQLWRSGPPNGSVTLQDVLVALAQVGTNCN